MKKADILLKLGRLDRDRQWLATATGYTYDYVKNSLAAAAREPSKKFAEMCERAFLEEERRREVDLTRPGASVWDLVYFNGPEMAKIDRARKAGGYDAIPPLYKDAVMFFSDHLLAEEARRSRLGEVESDEGERGRRRKGERGFWIDGRGGVAAGAPIDVVNREPMPVDKEYPEDHYALRVFGHSMEPKIPDGAVVVVREVPDNTFPKQGTIVVYSDAGGSTLKVLGYRPAKPGEDANAFGKVPTLKSLNPAFSEVVTMEGGRIEAIFVEVL